MKFTSGDFSLASYEPGLGLDSILINNKGGEKLFNHYRNFKPEKNTRKVTGLMADNYKRV